MHVDDGVARAGGEEAAQLRRGAVVVMPPQRVDDLVVLLDAAQQLQAGSLIHVDAPAAKRARGQGDNAGETQLTRPRAYPSSLPMATTFPSGFQLMSVCGDSLCCREAEITFRTTAPALCRLCAEAEGAESREVTTASLVVAHMLRELDTHLDVVGVSDQLVDVRRLPAQLRRVVLQDDAFAGAAVQAVGRFSSRRAWTSHVHKKTTSGS